MEDEALVKAIAAADQRALVRLYDLYSRRVLQYARSFVRDTATAEEIVVDTMLAVWNGARRFDGASRVSTWILGIARHRALDAVRRQRRAPAGRLDDAPEPVSDAAGPEQSADQDSQHRAIDAALDRLTAEHREVLLLAFYEELPYREIARLLDIPVNTVKTRVFYARQSLQAMLGDAADAGSAA